MKKILILFAAVFALVSCEMDLYRSDQMTSAMLAENPSSAVYTTDGNYAMFKDELEFGMTDRGGYTRVYFLMTELRGDNAALMNKTSDPLRSNSVWDDNDRLEDLSYVWYICYKIIYGCNTNIEALPAGQSAETDHLIGENYFLRAVCHLSLCNLFATPYSRGAEKPGVIIRNSTDVSGTPVRATVGEVYAQIEADLKEAMKFMQNGTPRGNKGYASYDAARGLLTRLYLYMERNDECVALCNEMLGSNAASYLDPNYETYFANALTSKETLWCIGRSANDAGFIGGEKGQLSSMYYGESPGSDAWVEIYWAEPFIDMILANPADKRNAYFHPYGQLNDGKKFIAIPEISDNPERGYIIVRDVAFDENAAVNTFTFLGNTFNVKKKEGYGYPIYYVENFFVDEDITGKDEEGNEIVVDVKHWDYAALDNDGVDEGTRCWVRDNIAATGLCAGLSIAAPMYGMSKFNYQDGYLALSSPVFIRWAEIILNRAEAQAKLGNDADALADVNVIRRRAGIPEWSVGNIGKYESVLDVVLDERRLELCFEGHRAIDVYRNGRNLDRRYGGVHPYEVITPDQMDIRYPYCIPYTETSVSGIPGNGRQ